jgi:tRNA 2-selenouridine synthase
MIKDINIIPFMESRLKYPVIDVRSPVEFNKGHIPGSFNVPLFTDDERAEIGTCYKQVGTDKAIELGESFAVPRIPRYLEKISEIAPEKTLLVLCFRGGLRSLRFSQLLDENGFTVLRLNKGYKNYRSHVQASFNNNYFLQVIGGKTGSGKTEILKVLEDNNEQILDLEGLSNHRGSAFGSIGMEKQPSTEFFENLMYDKLQSFNPEKRIWVEDESLNIGRVHIPQDFYEQMKLAPLLVLNMEKSFRVDRLCKDYASEGIIPLKEAIEKIQKRLGSERFLEAVRAIEKKDFHKAASIILDYYDKCYSYGLTNKRNSQIVTIIMENDDPRIMADIILKKIP